MFTHALLQALSTGGAQYQEYLSLREVIDLTIDVLSDESDEEAPHPQLHSPIKVKEMLQIFRRYEEALEACNRAIAIEPLFAYSYDIKGKILQAFQRLSEALEAYEQAIRLDPTILSSHEGKRNILKLLRGSKKA